MSQIDNFFGEYRFLSNFYVDSEHFCVERHYQAAKTNDPHWAARILLAPSPNDAKKIGRNAPLRSTWEEEKRTVMLTLLRVKFSKTDLAERLLATGDAKLIEGNWWGDIYWGVCDGFGENWLGRLLMKVRKELVVATELTGGLGD